MDRNDNAIEAALSYVGQLDVSLVDDRSYRRSYRALLRLFSEHVRFGDDESVLAGALAVYGWMPRMMTGVDRRALSDQRQALVELAKCEGPEAARQIILRLDAPAQEQVLRFVNGSVIGSSKFLHFVNPNSIPIWDKRVARCFGYKHAPQFNRVERFLDYLQIVSSVEGRVNIPTPFQNFLNEDAVEVVSTVRAIEFAMFLYGQHLSTGAPEVTR